MTQPDPTAAIEVWARMLCSADVHVYGADHPTWQQLVGEPGSKIRDDYRKAAAWLLPRLTVAAAPAGPVPATDRNAEEVAKHVVRAIFALKTPSPDGSAHYQSGWDDGLEAAMDAARDAVLAVLPAPDQQTAIERAFVERLAAELKGCCTECDACIEIAQRMAGKAQDGAAKRAPMDPVHILGIDAPAAVAQSGQPETDLVEQLARGLAGAAAVNRQRTAAPWDDLTAGQQDAYRQQARTILSPQTGQPATD